MLSEDIWPVAQFSRLSFDTTCLYVFAENKLISNVKKVSFFLEHPVNGNLTTVATNFVKFICIELGMLTWLITNPFAASVLILVTSVPRDPFTYKLEGCYLHLQMW